MYSMYYFWYVQVLWTLFSFCALTFVGFLLLSKDAFFHVISFFLNCYWLLWNSTFGSWFCWYSLGYCFYRRGNKVFIFVIWGMSSGCFLKTIKITMTLIQTKHKNRISLHTSKQEVRSSEIAVLTSVFEKSNSELKSKSNPNLERKTLLTLTFNVRILNRIN